MTSTINTNPNPAGRFGTFAGVFTPNVLTILGIILFLRLGWVVGQAGMWNALLIVFLANAISLLTGLSLSAVATSMNVKAGGNYYLISRSLGLEIGGAIGIPLYMSQAISVAFYIIGFTEALQSVPYFAAFDPRLISTAVALLFVLISYIGADFALKIQFVILAILISAIGSFFLGGWGEFSAPHITPLYTEGVTFWVVFAVFFPAVTGIEVGISMSGDLKDPSRSIPRGTIASILITAVIYMLVVVWFAFHAFDPMALIEDTLAMQSIALWPALILAGVWAATLSSALGSVLAAPRTLQAIAADRVLPHWMAGQMGSATEPRAAILVTGAIALFVIWLGDLNAVAPIISMFFLNTYGMVNLTAGIERFVSNPSYRPRFRVPWYISLLGAFGCYGVMFLINPLATVVAIVISYGVYFLLERRAMERTWGDVRSGFWFTVARFALLELEQQRWSPKNWRPNLMVFTGQPHNRQQLVEVSNWLSLGKGLVTFFQFIVGDVEFLAGHGTRQRAHKHIRNYIQENKMLAFAEVEIVPDFMEGVTAVAQAHGIGGLESNVALLGWSRTAEGRAMQMDLLRRLVSLQKSILFLNYVPQRGFGQRRVINIWWQGRGPNGDLMLLLAHLIQQHPSWDGAEIHLLRIIHSETGIEETKAHLVSLGKQVRVDVKPVIIVADSHKPIIEIIAANSADADLTMLGMQLPRHDDLAVYAERLDEMVRGVGSVLLVRSAETKEGLLVALE